LDAVSLMISITNREELDSLIQIYHSHGVDVNFVSLGNGTALIDSTPKAVSYSLVTGENWPKVRHALETEMEIDLPNRGIVFTVPLSSMGGMKQLMALLGSQKFKKGEESVMKNTKYELIIVIANIGYSDQIMAAAREAGAKGGTVIHAKGTGAHGSRDFYGVTLAEEKEMIYTVVLSEKKNAVMANVMEKCGVGKKPEAVLMSLPVTSTAGMRFYEMKEAKTEVQDGEQFAGTVDRENV